MNRKKILVLTALVLSGILTACSDVTAPPAPHQACGTGTMGWVCD